MKKDKRIIIKFLLCSVYLIIITILSVSAYKMYQDKDKVLSFSKVEDTNSYTYIDISKMSEKFAYYKESNIGIHYVIEKEDTGLWHIYLIAINEKEIDKYQKIIDYTYGKTKEVPKTIRVYGYPKLIDEDIKKLSIKNINKFIPKDNEIKITEKNYEKYLTNSYLDTTKEKEEGFNTILFITLLALLLVIILFIITLFDKGKKKTTYK